MMEANGQGATLETIQREIDCMLYLINTAARTGNRETIPALTSSLREFLGAVIPLDAVPWDEERIRADSRKLIETATRLKERSTVVQLFPS